MAKKYLTIDKFYGGQSTGSHTGPVGSFPYGYNLNFRTDPDYITINYAAVKDTGTTVVDLVKWITSYGADIYAYGDAGNIYKKSSGTWSVGRTVANSTGQGLGVYGDYLYYRQNSQIGRLDLVGAGGYTDNWQTSNVQTVTDWGAIETFLDFIAFANGRYLATWNDSTFTYNRLSWPKGYFVRDIGAMSEYLALAVNDNETITNARRGWIFFWDGTSTTYNFHVQVSEPVSAIQANADNVLAFGASGKIYTYNGTLARSKQITWYDQNNTAYVYPGSETSLNGLTHFGLASGTASHSHNSIYTWGQVDSGYPNALNLEYRPSYVTTNDVGTNRKLGAVKAIGTNLYFSWKNGTSYGIDLVSTSTYYTKAWYQSLVVSFNQPVKVTREKIYFKRLDAGETIELHVREDLGAREDWTNVETISYASDGGSITNKVLNYECFCSDLEIGIEFNGDGTSAPSVSRIVIEYEEEGNL